MIKNFYTNTVLAKNGTKIPVLYNGKTLESRYNPEGDADRNLAAISNIESINFFILVGLGSGILLEKLLNLKPNAFYLIIENSNEDINFLKKEFLDFTNSKYKNFKIITPGEISETLLACYVPSFYGNCHIIQQKVWCNENSETANLILQLIDISLKKISADYSVQSHFGKIWHKNILRNIKFIKNINVSLNYTGKTAAIIAAGPSLDQTIEKLKNTRPQKIIFSTDTASQTLIKKQIFPDFIVSIDSQFISSKHFLLNKKNFENTIFILDLSSPANLLKTLSDNKIKYILTENGHPLSQYCKYKINPTIASSYAGSGTVTIAALDFALKQGFTEIEIYGADYGFQLNKPYGKGTYLDTIYNENSTKINTNEMNFVNLMYRTKLIQNDYPTTEVLESYRKSMEIFLNEKKCKWKKEENIYKISNSGSTINSELVQMETKSLPEINFNKPERKIDENISLFSLTNEEICLLPLISWLRNYDNKKENFVYYLNKAKLIAQDML